MSEQHGPAGQASALAAQDQPGPPQAPADPATQPGTATAQPQPDTPAPGQPGTATAQPQPGTSAPGQPGTAAGQAQPGTSAPGQPAAATPRRHHVIRRTRTGGVWVAMGASAVVLLLLLIFILENQRQVNIGFFGAHASLPIGVAMLLAAVGGALVVIIPGTGRIIQLRLTARRHRRKDAAVAKAAAQQPPAAPQQPPAPQEQPPAAPAPQEQPPAAPVSQQPPANPDPQL
jgi:uncharacterized integral membrane protein